MPPLVIDDARAITTAIIERARNAEIRRVMIKRFGGGRDAVARFGSRAPP